MTEIVVEYMHQMAPYTHFVAFGLLILAGLNMPVSEDIVYIVSASIAATIVPEHTVKIFIGCFLGAYFSDIMVYGIGRYGARRLLSIPFFQKWIGLARVRKVETYFKKYGMKTLFFGRFVPFGMRNILFMSAGMARMKFFYFLVVDALALTVTSSILFYLGFKLGENFRMIFPYLDRFKFVFIAVGAGIVIVFVVRYWKKKHAAAPAASPKNQQ